MGDIQQDIKANRITLIEETEEDTTGPAHITLEGPDGNPILIDQHV